MLMHITSQTGSNLPDYNSYPHHGLEGKNGIPGNFSMIRRAERTEGSAALRWLCYCELAVSTQDDSMSLQHAKSIISQELTENYHLLSDQCPLGCCSKPGKPRTRRSAVCHQLQHQPPGEENRLRHPPQLLPSGSPTAFGRACLLLDITSGTQDYHSLLAPQ